MGFWVIFVFKNKQTDFVVLHGSRSEHNSRCSELGRTSEKEAPAIVRCSEQGWILLVRHNEQLVATAKVSLLVAA
ncbi:hypothetical protein A2U01_0033784, partial [Trifolium medium]|nr:hypothetical protein [Trifolium medium]